MSLKAAAASIGAALGHCRFFPHPAKEKESCFLNNLKSMFFIDYVIDGRH
ncbi:hypothetical protein [Rhizobium multihospitium]|nr:hypothetical protein [Rhizobium multihospitium]